MPAKKFAALLFFLIINATCQASVQLIVSNEPEAMPHSGRIQHFELQGGQKYRLLYHHQVPSGNFLTLKILAINPNRNPVVTTLNLISAGPSDDEVFSGQLLMQRFWQSQLKPAVVTINLVPGLKKTLLAQSAQKNRLLNGILEIQTQPVSGSIHLDIQAEDVSANPEWVSWDVSKGNPRRTDGFINDSELTQNYQLDCDGNTLNVRLGDVPFIFNAQNLSYEGHYGVWHHLQLQVTGLPSENAKAQILFLPKGGLAAATFLAQGKIVTFPAQKPGQTTGAFDLEALTPGQKINLQVEFMPQPGSNYPIELLFVCRSRSGG